VFRSPIVLDELLDRLRHKICPLRLAASSRHHMWKPLRHCLRYVEGVDILAFDESVGCCQVRACRPHSFHGTLLSQWCGGYAARGVFSPDVAMTCTPKTTNIEGLVARNGKQDENPLNIRFMPLKWALRNHERACR
jgi:hypothetical protein